MTDLHMHSLYSDDGEFSPACLVDKCAASGISLMSITDHNCVRANFEAAGYAHECGVSYIPGIEIDCRHRGLNFHVLGYGVDFESEAFAAIEENISSQSADASAAMLRATRAFGFSITERDMLKAAEGRYWKYRWTGEMFAEVLLSMPEYAASPLLAPYRDGGSRSDNPYVNFYWDFYSQGKPGYYEMDYPAMESVIAVIHKSGGLAVLAHPGINLGGNERLLGEICGLGLDGLEAFSSYHSPAVRDFYMQKAGEFGLFCTGGSDFHGATKPAVALGATGGSPDERRLLELLAPRLT